MPRLSSVDLVGARQVVKPELSGLPAYGLESIIEQSLTGLPRDATEDFMSTLGSLGKAVGPALQRAAPSIVQGAAQGSAAGPYGALIGAGLGLVSGLASQSGGPSRTPAAPAAPVTPAAPVIPAAPATPAAAATAPAPSTPVTPAPAAAPATPALPTGQGAAATLLSLLQNPSVQHALLSQVLGSSGGEEVPTASGTSVPRGAINNLLTQLLANATEGLPESESISEQNYLRAENGEYLIDPASPEQHAALVLSHVRTARQYGPESEDADFPETAEWMSESSGDQESEEWVESGESVESVEFY